MASYKRQYYEQLALNNLMLKAFLANITPENYGLFDVLKTLITNKDDNAIHLWIDGGNLSTGNYINLVKSGMIDVTFTAGASTVLSHTLGSDVKLVAAYFFRETPTNRSNIADNMIGFVQSFGPSSVEIVPQAGHVGTGKLMLIALLP